MSRKRATEVDLSKAANARVDIDDLVPVAKCANPNEHIADLERRYKDLAEADADDNLDEEPADPVDVQTILQHRESYYYTTDGGTPLFRPTNRVTDADIAAHESGRADATAPSAAAAASIAEGVRASFVSLDAARPAVHHGDNESIAHQPPSVAMDCETVPIYVLDRIAAKLAARDPKDPSRPKYAPADRRLLLLTMLRAKQRAYLTEPEQVTLARTELDQFERHTKHLYGTKSELRTWREYIGRYAGVPITTCEFIGGSTPLPPVPDILTQMFRSLKIDLHRISDHLYVYIFFAQNHADAADSMRYEYLGYFLVQSEQSYQSDIRARQIRDEQQSKIAPPTAIPRQH